MSYNKIEQNFNQYLTRREVCQLLKISLPTLDRLTRSGAIKGYRFKNGVDVLSFQWRQYLNGE